ncbi:hypothetical protein ABVT39_014738 [Epinephelus coioides]
MDLHVRLWDGAEVKTKYVGSEFLGHFTAVDIVKKISNALSETGGPVLGGFPTKPLRNFFEEKPAVSPLQAPHGALASPTTAPAMVIAELKSELQSIEQLIQDLLQRQSVLVSRLACLESVDNQRPLAPDPTAITSDGPGLLLLRTLKKYLFPSVTHLTSATMIFLFQTFSPPWRFPLGLSPPPHARSAAQVRKRSSPVRVTSPSDSPSSSSAPPGWGFPTAPKPVPLGVCFSVLFSLYSSPLSHSPTSV